MSRGETPTAPKVGQEQKHDGNVGLVAGAAGSAADGGNAAPREIRFGVDSGACTTIIGKNVCVDYPLMHSGLNFRAANGTPLPALGKRVLNTADGRKMRVQVGDVTKNLLSVADLCDTGHRVTFDNTTGYHAVHKETGAILKFERVKNEFDLVIKIKPQWV